MIGNRADSPATEVDNGNAQSPEAVILTRLTHATPLNFDDLVAKVPQLTWNQVFQAVDGLARAGVILLKRNRFEYELVKAG